jgi:serine/threonine-protein kinase
MGGTIIARRYRLLHALDTGSMGAVFAAEKIGTGERVAVKMLLPEFHNSDDLIARFLDEALAAQRLVHPNIVRVFDHGRSDDGTPFIVMELLEGVPVSAYLVEGAHIPLSHAVHIIQGLLAGLQLAHSRSVVHRDLKPANVFLARGASGKFEVKVLDFGIAKVMDMAGGMGSKTKTGIFLGTPAYMSPEQIAKPKTVDARSDLWSVGVMMYKMVTGRPPFQGQSEVDRLASILHDTPEPVEQIDPKLQPIAEFMVRALEKDPDRRFQSAAEMSAALSEGGAVARAFGQATSGPNASQAIQLAREAAVAKSSGERPKVTLPAEKTGGSAMRVFLLTFIVALLLAGAGAALWMHHAGKI